MPTITVDFETYQAITARRRDESVTEGAVVRQAMGLPPQQPATHWHFAGAKFPVGMTLRLGMSGRVHTATVTPDGLQVGGTICVLP